MVSLHFRSTLERQWKDSRKLDSIERGIFLPVWSMTSPTEN